MAPSQSLHALLDQTGWIHALARSLVADPHLAADLAQDTALDALEARPDGSRPLRAWLATVMRNNLAKLRRGEANRSAREDAVRRAELAPAAQEAVERAETHRNVVQAVLALSEPYRSTLLMRFFEQLSYDEIAKKTGVTRAAVNSRVTRGLSELRARLESTYGGDRRALGLALLPLAKLPTGLAASTTTFLGLKTMHLALGTAAATLVAASISVSVLSGGREPASPTPVRFGTLATPASAGAELATPAPLEPTAEPAAREAVLVQEHGQKRKESDENVWQTDLFHAQALPASIESIAVNTGSGDVEVLASASGKLEVQAHVRAKLGTVKGHELTQVFADHVDISEDDGTLVIEDAHKNTRGWSVSFVVSVPGSFPVQANSGSGDVVVKTGRTKVQANSGSGDVRVELPQERLQELQANSGSGSVVAEAFSVEDELNANSGSGDVRVRVGEALSPGKLSLNSGSGDLLLVVPANIVGDFELTTHGGTIELPPSLGLTVRTDVSGQKKAAGTLGSGGGRYRLSTGSGDVEVQLGHVLPAKDE
ncbi:MAG TPA: sigma-70 family RNA polymerase sigma factor [Planctomycetota bacterium]